MWKKEEHRAIATIESIKPDNIRFSPDQPSTKQLILQLGDQHTITASEGSPLFGAIFDKKITPGMQIGFSYSHKKEGNKITAGGKREPNGWFDVKGVEITEVTPGETNKLFDSLTASSSAPEYNFPDARSVGRTTTKAEEDYTPPPGLVPSSGEENF